MSFVTISMGVNPESSLTVAVSSSATGASFTGVTVMVNFPVISVSVPSETV